MPKPTTLATGQLNNSDQLEVELHRPADMPAFILIKWPAAPRSRLRLDLKEPDSAACCCLSCHRAERNLMF